uniref:Uncharacterized protein n=1 Tax=Anopheles maculatus TaxID=74869 RepID=A0A182S9F1_9DIPT
MEYKVDLERAIVADFAKSSTSKRYTKTIYTLTALSSIALGALVMALFYHWNEIQTIANDRRLEIQDVKEVIRLTDVLLTKHDENAANIEKLLTLFQHNPLQSEQATTDGKHFEENLTFKQPKDIIENDGNGNLAEGKQSTVSSGEHGDMSHRVENLTPNGFHSGITDSDETKQPDSASRDEKSSSESFQWKWSFPQSAWLKLSPYGINYGTSDDNTVLSKEQQ